MAIIPDSVGLAQAHAHPPTKPIAILLFKNNHRGVHGRFLIMARQVLGSFQQKIGNPLSHDQPGISPFFFWRIHDTYSSCMRGKSFRQLLVSNATIIIYSKSTPIYYVSKTGF